MSQKYKIKPEASIRSALHKLYPAHILIKKKELDKPSLHKSIFIDTVEKLIKIDQRRDYLLETVGIDVTGFEDIYFHIIENLFNLCFSKNQLELLRTYIYELAPNEEWDGFIDVSVNGKQKKVQIKTPRQVWDLLQKIK